MSQRILWYAVTLVNMTEKNNHIQSMEFLHRCLRHVRSQKGCIVLQEKTNTHRYYVLFSDKIDQGVQFLKSIRYVKEPKI